MPRATRLHPDAIDDEQRHLYDAIVGGPRGSGPQLFELRDAAGVLNGPFNAFLLSPKTGEALQSVGAALRFSSSVSPRLREMAILLVAARWDSDFEWYAHERVGRSVGVTDAELETLRSGARPFTADANETAGLRLVAQLLAGDVSDEDFATARAVLDESTIFEMSTLVGYYGTLALQLRLFRVGAPSEESKTHPLAALGFARKGVSFQPSLTLLKNSPESSSRHRPPDERRPPIVFPLKAPTLWPRLRPESSCEVIPSQGLRERQERNTRR